MTTTMQMPQVSREEITRREAALPASVPLPAPSAAGEALAVYWGDQLCFVLLVLLSCPGRRYERLGLANRLVEPLTGASDVPLRVNRVARRGRGPGSGWSRR